MRDFAGLILAGGEGRRWGGPKAWATLPDGKSFLESCFKTLRSAGAHPIVATLPPGTNDPGLTDLTTVVLQTSGLDMFASLVTGLGRLVEFPNWHVVAILPVDHPLVSPKTVVALSEATATAAIPSFNGKHGHPVCVARSIVESIVDETLTGPTLREVLRSVDTGDLSVDDPGVISNCNTPEALAAAIKHLGLESQYP